MRTSESIKEIATALAKAQGAIEGAKKGNVNPHFKSRYADLESAWEACRDQLSKNGISVIQPVCLDDGRQLLVTRLMHSSGEWVEDGGIPLLLSKEDMQGLGSALTYARRYGLMAMVGIAPEDDDGNAAVQKPTVQQTSHQLPVPAGYVEWWEQVQDAASNGLPSVEKMWKSARPEYRQHLDKTNRAGWERLKAKASQAESVPA